MGYQLKCVYKTHILNNFNILPLLTIFNRTYETCSIYST